VKLLLATTSQGKLREQREALADLEIELLSLDDIPAVEPPDEPGSTFRENAGIKALYYHRATGYPALAEAAGLVVDALGGAPGVESDRTARYVSALALADGGAIVFESEATCEGRISLEPRGEGGFGYDPVFSYPPFGRTMSELSKEEKNAVSHRGKAISILRDHLFRSDAWRR
jgi:XTP/dITP diphosphohydrolase